LVEQGPLKKGNWNVLLNYLEGHAVGDRDASNPAFDSPIPPYSIASPDLERELISAQGPKQDETPLRIAALCKACPSNVVAALCHLGPEAARLGDAKSRLPLHWACRRPTDDPDAEQALKILVSAYPQGLLHRDDGGRTPLHYLFWYHASTRSVNLVEHFLQELPSSFFTGLTQLPTIDGPTLPAIPRVTQGKSDVPHSAAIIYDCKHGALPLHYAVMGGASKEVVKLLLQHYPHAKLLVDRRGRSSLAWLFGAGEGEHVSGECPDPNAPPLYEQKVSSNIVHLLLGSKVARMTDDTGRTPLHWACWLSGKHYYMAQPETSCISVRVVQMLLDHYTEGLLVQDTNGKTPLHLLFDVVLAQQDVEWQRLLRNQLIRTDVDLRMGQAVPVYSPPRELVDLLLRCPDSETQRSAAHVEDEEGRLPLHAAVATGTSLEVIQTLIQSYPTALVHTTEETLQTPLHTALASPFIAPLQNEANISILLQAYVTSRHGTFVNGKLALKLEDSNGMYPLHHACQNQACLNVISTLVDRYPRACRFPNGNGDLPVHCLLNQESFFGSTEYTLGASLAAPMGWMSQEEESFRVSSLQVMQQKIHVVVKTLATDNISLMVGSSAHGMLPLHIVVAFDAAPYVMIYHMLETCPIATQQCTTAVGHSYTPLDLHDMRRPAAKDENHWNQVCELLFAYGPTLETHRHNDELLDRFASLIRDEITGVGSYHLTEWIDMKKTMSFHDLAINETLSTVQAPEIDTGTKPKPKTPRSTPKAQALAKKSKKKKKPSPTKSPQGGKKKSIYDDDGDGGYVVSIGSEYDDDEFSGCDQSDEEYDSEYDSDTFDRNGTFDENTFQTESRTLDDETSLGQTFDDLTIADEKKGVEPSSDSAIPVLNVPSDNEKEKQVATPFLSQVALRIFTFFVLYRNPFSVEDNYSKQVDMILDSLDFSIAEKLVSLEVPWFAKEYVRNEHGSTFAQAANNFCRAIIHRIFYFMGKYEFLDDGILIQKSNDDQTVLIRALEYTVNIDEVRQTNRENPGIDEAAIWETGEFPVETSLYAWTTYSITSRKVCFKFMKSQQAYKREVMSREIMGVSLDGHPSSSKTFTPLINHFNSHGLERKVDRRYKLDCQDDRFSTLHIFDADGLCRHEGKKMFLPDYPFALVLPLHEGGDLFSHFLNHGKMSMEEIRLIGRHIGQALTGMHEKGLVHGQVSLQHISSIALPDVDEGHNGYWTLTGLSSTCMQSSDSFMAGIEASGVANFSTGSFPPELFTKLTPGELLIYNHYWDTVQSAYNVSLDPTVINPQVDSATGEPYVLKCYFMGGDKDDLPPLPYPLVPVRETVDIWSFGKTLFTLCSSGHPLFPTNIKSGHVLAYDQVAKWDHDNARALIYKNVDDPLAQDLLLHILTIFEDRSILQMATLLIHPFFTQLENNGSLGTMLKQIVEQRSIESRMYIRSHDVKSSEQAEKQWLSQRTKSVVCWDLEFQSRIYLSPSNLIKRGCTKGQTIADMPLSLLVLPYKLLRNKSGKLTPSTKKDVERAERMGIQLLALSKACHFVALMDQVVDGNDDSEAHKWSTTEVSAAMALSSDDFKGLEEEMTILAAQEIELFRENPVHVARRLIHERIKDLQASFDESKKAFFYLVDEYEGIPIVELDTPYPHEADCKISELLQNTLPLMHLSALYMRGVAGSVTGLVKLIFEAAYPHIPPSWSAAASGLEHVFDEERIVMEVKLLRGAISDLYGNKRVNPLDDIHFLQEYLQTFDPLNTYANLKRVTSGESSLWTSDKGLEKINDLASASSIEKARKDQADQKAALMWQQKRIVELENALENLEFRRDHELNVGVDWSADAP